MNTNLLRILQEKNLHNFFPLTLQFNVMVMRDEKPLKDVITEDGKEQR